MKFENISNMAPVNEVDEAKVRELAESMKSEGWKGAPILFCNIGLVTGSHRLAALQLIEREADESGELAADVLWEDVAEDVTDEVNAYCEREGVCFDDIQFDRLRDVFEGTWVEQYKDEIVEW